MKNFITIISVFLSFYLLAPVPGAAEAGHCDLTVNITGLRNDAGKVMVGLYSNSRNFLKTPGNGAMVPIKRGKATTVFRQVPYGTYAIAVYHDENRNNKIDTNPAGVPKEGSGVSNNPKPRMGPPRWQDATFKINKPSMNMRVKLNYF